MKKFLCIILIVLLSLVCFACNKQKNAENEKNHYYIDISLEDNCLECEQKLEYINNIKEECDCIKFNLYANAYRKDAKNKAYAEDLLKYGGIDIKSLKFDGKEKTINLSEDKNILTINDIDMKYGEKACIEMTYKIDLPECKLRLGKYDKTINVGNFYPILCVYENNMWREDEFSIVGDPFYSEVADYDIIIRTDPNMEIATCGEIYAQNIIEGKKVYQIKIDNVREYAFVASESFQRISKIVGDTTVFYSYIIDENPKISLETAANAIKLFSQTFGKYPYSTYNVVETAFEYGGMEYPTLVYINNSLINSENVIVHETAHQWWYGVVGIDEINESYIDEGLTTFSTNYYYLLNGDEKKFIEEEKDSMTNYQNYLAIQKVQHPDYVSIMDMSIKEFSTFEYNMIAYEKSNLMFKTIYDTVGRAKFEKSLSTFYENNKYKIAKKQDLYQAFDSSCNKEVSPIFDAWISGSMKMFRFC